MPVRIDRSNWWLEVYSHCRGRVGYGDGYGIDYLTAWIKKVQTRTMDEDIRAEIIEFRKKLDKLNGKEFSWAYTPVSEFEEKENYPLDFQIFMEEIGELSAGSDVDGKGGGTLYLILEEPIPLLNAEESGFYYLAFTPGLNDQFDLPNRKKVSADKILVTATDVDGRNYAFANSTKPYTFFSLTGEDWQLDPLEGNFFTWFRKHMAAVIGISDD